MKALLLISGGIDSPVAAHLLQRQGLELSALHFSYAPFTDTAPEEKSALAAASLGLPEIEIVDGGSLFAEIPQKTRHTLYYVLAKRFMLRVADRVAQERGIPYLATGENLGQVSSQTLSHLAAIDRAATRPILRPLLAWDKREIIDLARAIDTFEISKGPEVCDVLGPKHPATSATVAEVEAEEAKLDVDWMAKEAVARLRRRPILPAAAVA